MAFMSDKNTASFLLVQAEAHSLDIDTLAVIARVARVADRTLSHMQINREKLLAIFAR